MRTRFFLSFVTLFALASIAPTPTFAASNIDDPLNDQWAYEAIGAQHAWSETLGSRNVIVAVIDNGFDILHPDLRGNVWKNVDEIADNGIDDDNNGYIDDVWGWNFAQEDINDDGLVDEIERKGNNDVRPHANTTAVETVHHGTLVAGLIGAVGGNGKGISGIAPRVQLMNVRVVDESGQGTFASLATAIHYAVDNGADIINMSLVGPAQDDVRDAVQYAFDHGVAVVAAAGNGPTDLDSDPLYPVCADRQSAIRTVLGVSAINEDRRAAFFSNIGATCIDLTAPGVNMTSTVRFSPTNGLTKQYSGGWNGTSFAAPLVSGTLALLKSLQPAWGPTELYDAVIATVHHTPGQDESVYTELFGAGLLQVDKAVAYAKARVLSLRQMVHAVLIAPAEGLTSNIKDAGSSSAPISQVSGIVDMVAFSDHGEAVYALVREGNAHTYTVEIRDETLTHIRHSFSLDVRGTVRVAVDASHEHIVISPQYADTVLFSVYAMDGSLIRQVAQERTHTGVSLALSYDGHVAVLTQSTPTEETLRLYSSIDADATVTERTLPSAQRGDILYADIDGDRVDELVIGGAPGVRPLVSTYEADGTLKRTFSVYDGYTGGFRLYSADVDGDGMDDILTLPYTASQDVRVWSGKSKLISTFPIFAHRGASPVFMALWYTE